MGKSYKYKYKYVSKYNCKFVIPNGSWSTDSLFNIQILHHLIDFLSALSPFCPSSFVLIFHNIRARFLIDVSDESWNKRSNNTTVAKNGKWTVVKAKIPREKSCSLFCSIHRQTEDEHSDDDHKWIFLTTTATTIITTTDCGKGKAKTIMVWRQWNVIEFSLFSPPLNHLSYLSLFATYSYTLLLLHSILLLWPPILHLCVCVGFFLLSLFLARTLICRPLLLLSPQDNTMVILRRHSKNSSQDSAPAQKSKLGLSRSLRSAPVLREDSETYFNLNDHSDMDTAATTMSASEDTSADQHQVQHGKKGRILNPTYFKTVEMDKQRIEMMMSMLDDPRRIDSKNLRFVALTPPPTIKFLLQNSIFFFSFL